MLLDYGEGLIMAKNAKKGTYTFKELGEIVMKKYPGKFVHLESASVQCAHVAQRLGIEDINGKKKYKQITASDAEKILEDMRQSYENHPRTHSTPLERMAKQEEPQAVTSEQIDVTLPPSGGIPQTMTKPLCLHIKSFEFPEPERVTPSEKKADEFEARRKKFYTDVNYFLKYAQSKDERVAIWGALSKLYGITALPARRIEEAKPETAETSDKWSI